MVLVWMMMMVMVMVMTMGRFINKKKKIFSSLKYFRPAYSISCNNPGSDLAGEAQNDIALWREKGFWLDIWIQFVFRKPEQRILQLLLE